MENRLQELDQKIRQGRLAEVREELESLNRKSVERKYWAQLAALARRVGMFLWALRLLKPLIHQEIGGDQASAKEKIIYAANLIKIGSFAEAQKLLGEALDQENEARLYLSFSYISQWEYEKAIPLLNSYIANVQNPYEKCVGQVNLAAAYLQTRSFEKCEKLLAKIARSTQENNWHLLYGNSLELSANLCIIQKNAQGAEQFLSLMRPLLPKAGPLFNLFYDKWLTISKAMKLSDESAILGEMHRLEQHAKRLEHGESLRECEFFRAIMTKDMNLFDKLYFGTPHKSFLTELIREFPNTPIPNEYEWQLEKGASAQNFCLFDGSLNGRKILKCGSLPHRLLTFLSLDFYRPYMIGQLYSYLYPEQYFNPQSAPDRVAKVVQRTRQELKQNGMNLSIALRNQSYALTPKGPLNLLLTKDRAQVWEDKLASQNDERLASLQKRWPDQPFSSSQAGQVLDLSKRSAQSLLAEAKARNLVNTKGYGPAQRYFFKKAG